MTTRRLISLFKTVLVWILMIVTFSIGFAPQQTSAAFMPSTVSLDAQGLSMDRETSLKKIQTVLESRLIRQRLTDLGLTESEILTRLGQLSDQQIHQIATQLDSLQPGGDALGTIVVLLVIAILVVIFLQLTGHKVIITKQ